MIDLTPWSDLHTEDFPRLQVLADALEETGDDRCEGLRWIVKNRRWPMKGTGTSWWWYNYKRWRATTLPYYMPDWMIEGLKHLQSSTRRKWVSYDTALEAILAAASVVVSVRSYLRQYQEIT